jgi:hypothetical protein
MFDTQMIKAQVKTKGSLGKVMADAYNETDLQALKVRPPAA